MAQATASLQPLMHNILQVELHEPTLQHYSDYDRAQFLRNSVELLPGARGWSGLRLYLQTPLWVLAALGGAVLLLACANLAHLGLELDQEANDRCRPDADIALTGSRARILVIATNEDLTILRQTRALLESSINQPKEIQAA